VDVTGVGVEANFFSAMLWIIIILLVLLIVFLIWEIWICEGAHLGRRFVVWLYDLAASRYERIKGFDPGRSGFWVNRSSGR
jgi:hypothetical protein